MLAINQGYSSVLGEFFIKAFRQKGIEALGVSEELIAEFLYSCAVDEVDCQFSRIGNLPSNFKKAAIARFMFVFAEKLFTNKDQKQLSECIKSRIAKELGEGALDALDYSSENIGIIN